MNDKSKDRQEREAAARRHEEDRQSERALSQIAAGEPGREQPFPIDNTSPHPLGTDEPHLYAKEVPLQPGEYKFPVEPLVVEGVKPRSGLPSPPTFSPMKYDPEKHRDRLDVILRARFILGVSGPGQTKILHELNNPDIVDLIFASVEELQLELVRESMAEGVGLEAFFPSDERRAIKIAKPVRERIEQVILMLGDAFVQHCDNKSKESSESEPDLGDEFTHGRLMAHKAKETYADEGHAEGALCELAEAFGLATIDQQLVGMREGVDGWDLAATWSHAQKLCASERFAVHFILSVWSSAPAWDGLDITRAFAMWDARKRGAFTGWTEKPWWP